MAVKRKRAEVSARIGERCFRALKAGVQRVAAQDTPIPSAMPLERAVLPSVAAVLAAADRLFE